VAGALALEGGAFLLGALLHRGEEAWSYGRPAVFSESCRGTVYPLQLAQMAEDFLVDDKGGRNIQASKMPISFFPSPRQWRTRIS
jgi:hypothetical protein